MFDKLVVVRFDEANKVDNEGRKGEQVKKRTDPVTFRLSNDERQAITNLAECLSRSLHFHKFARSITVSLL
jgi:hypothetical protein